MKKFLLFIGVLSTFFMNSCLVSKKVVFLSDMNPSIPEKVTPIPPLRIQKNDRLSIQVSSKNAELAAPFNNRDGLYSVSQEGHVGSNLIDRGYLVDQQGNIEFPILGTINVEGLTIDGLRDYIKSQLENKNLLSGAVIKIELINLKVLVMGEAGNSVINAPDGRLTLLEAITQSGGLSPNATVDRIAVIREENGERRIYYNDIQSKSIFNSPTYYLQQNDIIYVEPKAAVARGEETRTWRILGMVLSIITLGTTVWAISTR